MAAPVPPVDPDLPEEFQGLMGNNVRSDEVQGLEPPPNMEAYVMPPEVSFSAFYKVVKSNHYNYFFC